MCAAGVLQERSGNEGVHLLRAGVNFTPPNISMATARKEAEMVLFESVSEALRETNMHPRQVLLPLSDACSISHQGILASIKMRTAAAKAMAGILLL